MIKNKKNLPIYVLSIVLIFVGFANASNAQGSTTVGQLEKRIKKLEAKNKDLSLTSQVLVKIVLSLKECSVPVTSNISGNVATGYAHLNLCEKK